jgi:hypothetical protein
MKYFIKTYFNQKRGTAAIVLLVGLLLATLLFALPHQPAVAQGSSSDRVTYASVDGQSAIVSQQMVLEAGDFARGGTVDNLQITPDGLILAAGVTRGIYLSEAIRSPLDFTTDVGPAWLADVPAGASVSVEARLSDDGQSWGEWAEVPVEYYPTRAGEYGGTLVWVDKPTAYVQFKLTLQAGADGLSPRFRRLKLFFNDTSQGPSDEVAVAQARNEVTHASLTCPAKPLVIPRSTWGCPPGQTSPFWPPAYEPVTHIVVNHTATPNSADDWARVVRSIWNYHANILGWGDIGYQYLIDPLGNIYEGRAGGDDVIGAFDGFNRGAMGIGYIGCYGNCDYLGLANAEPSTAMLTAGNVLMAWKVDQKEIDPFGTGQYCFQTLPNIVSRSDVTCRGGSLSPGDFLDARVPEMRMAVADIISACQAATPTPGVTVIITTEPSTTPSPTDQTPTPTPTSQTPTPGVTVVITLDPTTPTPSPTNQTPMPTETPTPTVTPTPTTTATGSTVALFPASLQLGLDGTGVSEVEAANISDLYGVDLRLTYDPNVLAVVDADPNAPGVQVEAGTVFEDVAFFVAKNEASDGVINFIAARQSPAPTFSGTGSLIQITWQGKTLGQTPVTLEGVKLSDPDGLPLSATLQDGQVEVSLGIIVQGHVALQGSDDSSRAVVAVGAQQVATSPDGQFEIEIAPANSDPLTIVAPGYLSAQTAGEVFVGSTVIDLGNITLLGGEVTGDNRVDIFDLTFIGSRYNGTDSLADVNGDGAVDIFDLTLTASNYGQRGPVMIGVDLQP